MYLQKCGYIFFGVLLTVRMPKREVDLTGREDEKDGQYAAGTDRGKWAFEGIL